MEQMGLSDPKDWVDKYGDYLFRSAILRVRDEVVAEEDQHLATPRSPTSGPWLR